MKYLPDEKLLIHQVESNSASKRIYRAFKRVISDSRERSNYWQELSENALLEIIFILLQMLSKKMDPRIEETLHLISYNMREPVRIDTLAQAVGLSASRLSHLFKENTGRSIVETVNEMRIRQAALLLQRTDRKASDVSLDVGFPNYNYFAKQFQKRYGVSPSSYRNNHLP